MGRDPLHAVPASGPSPQWVASPGWLTTGIVTRPRRAVTAAGLYQPGKRFEFPHTEAPSDCGSVGGPDYSYLI
jgi:hypothetical protein